jgi:hypothetical protein
MRSHRVRLGSSPSGKGRVAYSSQDQPVLVPPVVVPSQGSVISRPGKISFVYTEGDTVASMAKDIQDLDAAVRRIEVHLGVAPSRPAGELQALGWTSQQIEETRAKLARVEEDWSDPAMDVYDEL